MPQAKKAQDHVFEVVVSFDGLNKGERFTATDEATHLWATMHVENGYLQDVTGEPTTQEAQNAGEVGQG